MTILIICMALILVAFLIGYFGNRNKMSEKEALESGKAASIGCIVVIVIVVFAIFGIVDLFNGASHPSGFNLWER